MSHPGEVSTRDPCTGQHPGQQQVESCGLEVEGARGDPHDLGAPDTGEENHGAGEDGCSVKHLGRPGIHEPLTGQVVGIHRKAGCRNQEICSRVEISREP